MAEAHIGVIGGSGLYAIDGLADVETVYPDTPFGKPSDEIVIGTLSGARVAFVPRHGRGHAISPSELPSQANVWALRMLGVRHVLSISAVGSLRLPLAPRHIVLPDQLIDRTRGLRPATFFGGGIVAHVAFAEPYCADLRRIVYGSAREVVGDMAHDGGTLVVMEGPQFSTRAESRLYRQVGGDLIGMTALPEAKLVREAGMCYCTLALVTDYDSWHEDEETVTVDMVVANMRANTEHARAIVALSVPRIEAAPDMCDCRNSLRGAIITQADAIPAERREALWPLIGPFVPQG
jgi:5'-methylthioadenosine phosphorylase